MRTPGLYEPSLSAGPVRPTRSYNIGSLFYVAFFGGALALGVLGIRNAVRLHVRPPILYSLAILTLLVFTGKMMFYYGYFHGGIPLDRSGVRIAARGAELVLYGIYYWAMRKAFRQHLLLGGGMDSLRAEGVLWCVLSIVAEGIGLMFVARNA